MTAGHYVNKGARGNGQLPMGKKDNTWVHLSKKWEVKPDKPLPPRPLAQPERTKKHSGDGLAVRLANSKRRRERQKAVEAFLSGRVSREEQLRKAVLGNDE